MNCAVCDDQLEAAARRCTFCGYDLATGKRGRIDAPPRGAARASRREGVRWVIIGTPAVVGALLLLVLPLTLTKLLAIGAIPAAGGLLARGLVALAQAKRWDKKQRLFDEQNVPMLASSSEEGSVVAVPSVKH